MGVAGAECVTTLNICIHNNYTCAASNVTVCLPPADQMQQMMRRRGIAQSQSQHDLSPFLQEYIDTVGYNASCTIIILS